jgi:membrane-bound lytic murein transglycosylase B
VRALAVLAVVLAGAVAKPAADVAEGTPSRPTHHATRARVALAPAPAPSSAAKGGIPAAYLALYRQAAHTCSGLRWSVLAGIGKVETNHGRSTLPGVRSGENFAGAGGPMQFLSGTWAVYGRGGNRYDPRDAIPAAARLLCANGVGAAGGVDRCPGLQGTAGEHTAIHAYNHACWYVAQVLDFARTYQSGGR